MNENDGQRESESVTYEISRIVARTLTSPGEIRRLSIAVVVNAPRPAAGGADPKAPSPPRSPEELEKIRGVVMTAVGFSESRGDSVTVVEMPFDTSLLDRERALLDQPAPPVPARMPELTTIAVRTPIVAAAGVLTVLLLAFVAWLILRGRARTRARAEVALTLERVPAPATARGAVASPAQPAVSAVPHAPQPIVSDDVLQLTREREEIRQKAFAMASGEPDATAQLLRAWMVKKKAAVNAASVVTHGS